MIRRLIILLLIVGCSTEPETEDSCSISVEIEYCICDTEFTGGCKTIVTNTGIDTLYGWGYTITFIEFRHTTVDSTIIIEGVEISGTVDIPDTTIIEEELPVFGWDENGWFKLPDSTQLVFSGMPCSGLPIDSLQYFISNQKANCSKSPLNE